MPFCPELEKAVYARVKAEKTTRTSGSDTLNPKEKQSLQKLVLGLAVVAYRYAPKQGPSKIYQEIKKDLEDEGIVLDVDTVRKHLIAADEAFRHLIEEKEKDS